MAIFSSFLVHKKNEIDKEIILTIFSLHLSLYVSIEISTFLLQKSKSFMKYQKSGAYQIDVRKQNV